MTYEDAQTIIHELARYDFEPTIVTHCKGYVRDYETEVIHTAYFNSPDVQDLLTIAENNAVELNILPCVQGDRYVVKARFFTEED